MHPRLSFRNAVEIWALMPTTESTSGLDLVVCACGEQEYTARDAIDAAIFRGDLDVKWKEFLHQLAAERRADELDLEPDDAAISRAAEAFRYEYDLITAEETEAWLANRGLTLDDFADYLTREYYASTLHEELVADETEYSAAEAELRQSFVAQLILSGELDRMTGDLIVRLAARCAGKESLPDAILAEKEKFLHRNGIKLGKIGTWLEQLKRDPDWLADMLAMEAAYRKHCNTLLVPDARQRELLALRLPLTRFETETIEVESLDAAHEALFCVREDGMSMEEVANEGGYPYRRVDFILEDLPTDSQHRFLSVSAGEMLQPFAHGDGFELCRIVKKIEPQPEDPSVRSRIDQRLLDRHFAELTSKYTQRRLGSTSTPGAE
jgi:hypothetical protein